MNPLLQLLLSALPVLEKFMKTDALTGLGTFLMGISVYTFALGMYIDTYILIVLSMMSFSLRSFFVGHYKMHDQCPAQEQQIPPSDNPEV